MSDIVFNCPKCGKSLATDEEAAGLTVQCPDCSQAIVIPHKAVAVQPSPATPMPASPPAAQQAACPMCGELILATAKKCKHCGEFLDGSTKSSEPARAKKPEPKVENLLWKGNPSARYYKCVLICGSTPLLLFALGFTIAAFTSDMAFILLAILFVIPGLLLIPFAHWDRITREYTLTNKRATSKFGIFNKVTNEVGTKDIRNINIVQGLFERLVGVGTVEIESAAAAGAGHVCFSHIENPKVVLDLIRRQKDEADVR